MLTIVGPSGSGKSSVVRAGLVPALRRGALPAPQDWFVAVMVPGDDPFRELANALAALSPTVAAGADQLRADPERVLGEAIGAITAGGHDLVLVIDQLEELFTLSADDGAGRTFLDALAAVVADPTLPRPAGDHDPGRLRRPAALPRPVRAAGARLDGVRPAAAHPTSWSGRSSTRPTRAGCEFEAGLVSRIVADVGDQPGSLPLLQYALTELYERRGRRGEPGLLMDAVATGR